MEDERYRIFKDVPIEQIPFIRTREEQGVCQEEYELPLTLKQSRPRIAGYNYTGYDEMNGTHYFERGDTQVIIGPRNIYNETMSITIHEENFDAVYSQFNIKIPKCLNKDIFLAIAEAAIKAHERVEEPL